MDTLGNLFSANLWTFLDPTNFEESVISNKPEIFQNTFNKKEENS